MGGGILFLAVISSTFVVRATERRPIAEPLFPLLIALEAGSIAGLIAGYYAARSDAAARRARRASNAMTFVNSFLRH